MQSFRRGIDRRAYVLARAQCGDTHLVYQALAGVDRDFNLEAKDLPIAQWPIRFWTLLLSRKELTQGSSPWPALASITHGSRAALLLRLVGGLDFSHAAQVLGISEDTYRFALQRGLEQLQSGGYNMPQLEQLRDAFFDEVKQLSPEELSANINDAVSNAVINRDTAAAIATPDDDTPAFIGAIAPKKKPSKLWLWLTLTGLLLALATVAGVFLYQKNQREHAAQILQRATAEDLLAGDLLMHADYDMIAAGKAINNTQAFNFYSWLAAGNPPEIRLDLDPNQATPTELTNSAEPAVANENVDQE
jgi:hypothetical protein